MCTARINTYLADIPQETKDKWIVRGKYAAVALTVAALATVSFYTWGLASAMELAAGGGKYWFTIAAPSTGWTIGSLRGLGITSASMALFTGYISLNDKNIFNARNHNEFIKLYTVLALAGIAGTILFGGLFGTVGALKCWFHHGRVFTQL